MANKTKFVCSNCGANSAVYLGKCPVCGEWNTYEEESINTKKNERIFTRSKQSPQKIEQISLKEEMRIATPISEFNRVLGGGIVPGSLILLGGEPGIGKSTLVLQLGLALKQKVLYISGEESLQQIKLRAERLANSSNELFLLSETLLENALQAVEDMKPDIVIIDSIQTLQTEKLDSIPGTISQIKECATVIQNYAKTNHIAFIIIGHITKDGTIAGPKLLEHIVDTVLQFEGDNNFIYRILRSSKNRFGSTSEIGIFEMRNSGLEEVTNPSELLMSHSKEDYSGVSIAAVMEGVRPLLIEVQALVSSAVYGNPQRSTTTFDIRRLNMLLAVLEKKAGFRLSAKDVFLNTAGGIKIYDPSLDLAIIIAILSSDLDVNIHKNICFAGEVSLTGEIRPVSRIEQRINEAQKLGFKKIFVSKYSKNLNVQNYSIEVVLVNNIQEVFKNLFSFK